MTKYSSKRPLTDAEEREIQDMIASDPDNPELTDEQMANLQPIDEVLPELAASLKKKAGRPKSDNPKVSISLRVDQDVLEKFKATGRGWQSRMNDALKRAKV